MFSRANTWQVNTSVFFIISCGVLLGLVFGQVNGAVAIFFPATGISAALYYIFKKRVAVGLFSGIFLTNFIYRIIRIDESVFQSFTLAVLFLLSNFIGIIIFCMLLRRLNYKVESAFSIRESRKFIVTLIASSAASALTGVMALWFHFADIDFIETFLFWMIGDATGIIVFGGLILNHQYYDKPILSKKNHILAGVIYFSIFAIFIFFMFGDFGNNFLSFGSFQVFIVLMYIITAFVFSFRMIAFNNILFLLGVNFLHFPTYSGDNFVLDAIVLCLFLIIMSSIASAIRLVILDRQNNYEQVRIAKESLEKIIISTNNFVNVENRMPDEEQQFDKSYLQNMFEIACEIYPDFDRASCNLINEDKVEFIAAVGYDVVYLNSMKLPVTDFLWDSKSPEIFTPIQYIDKFKGTDETKAFTKSYGLPIESIRFTVNIGENRFAGMSFDLFENSAYNFTEKDIHNFRSFQRLMNSYYKIGVMNNEKDILKDDIVLSLVRTLELYDLYTSGHSEQVAQLCADFAKDIDLSSSDIRKLYWAGIVHDIGKIGLPADILNMQRKLTDSEFEQVKKHPENGHRILSKSKSLTSIADIVLHHHEWWNGNGYPHGLKGKEISYHARILHVCDAVDAMAKDRIYRRALTQEQIIEQLINGRGKQFNPEIADKMIAFIQAGKLKKTL